MTKTKKTNEVKETKQETDVIVVVQNQIGGMNKMLQEVKVTSKEELMQVSDKIKQVKSVKKYITEQRDKLTIPAKAIIEEAKAKYDPFIKECINAEEKLKGMAQVFMIEEERKRIEAEKKIVEKVETGYIKPETAIKKMEALPEAQKTIATGNSQLRMTKRAVPKIVNPELVPDKYWIINEVQVRKEALEIHKAGGEQIPGVEIIMESSMGSY